MKQYGFLGLVLSASVSMFAGETPEAPLKQSPHHALKKSNSSGRSVESLRTSSDAITIALLSAAHKSRKKEEQPPVISTGSSPLGATYLFPGQTGIGARGDTLPIDPRDTNMSYYHWN